MNMHSCTWRVGILAYEGEGVKEKERKEEGRYLLDDWHVEAVKTAVQPHALRERKTQLLSQITHTLDKQVQP